MSRRLVATSQDERACYFTVGGEDLLGVITRPMGPAASFGVVASACGEWVPGTHRNSMYVRLARRLAPLGIPTIRFDYHGVGESTGEVPFFELESPFRDDVLGAVDCLRQAAPGGVVLVGTCFGARSALVASQAVSDLRGVLLVSMSVADHSTASHPLSWYVRNALSLRTLKRLRTRSRRYARIAVAQLGLRLRTLREPTGVPDGVSPIVLDGLMELVKRKVPVLMMYGTSDVEYRDFVNARQGRLGDVIDDAGDLVSVVISEGELHGETTLESQDHIVETAVQWLQRIRNEAHAGDDAGKAG